MSHGNKDARRNTWAIGLTDEQKAAINAVLPSVTSRSTPERPREGWWVYRVPSVANPPTTLRLHYYALGGREVWYPITEGGEMVAEADRVPLQAGD